MPTLYVSEHGAVLRKDGERLRAEKDGELLADVPLDQVELICAFGMVHLTTPLILELLEREIETAFFSTSGKLRGQLTPSLPKNSPLRVAQYEKHRDESAALSLAQRIVRAKLRNSAEVLERFEPESPSADYHEARRQLNVQRDAALEASSLDTLRGYEGAAARAYWSAFSGLLKHDIPFTGRKYFPAPDPVNASLSLGYSLLTAEIQSLLDGIGFDPYLGFLHVVEYGRASLALDLLEEYRAPIVDRLVLYLFNNRIMKVADFETIDDGGMRLKPEPRKRFFREYEQRMTRGFRDPDYQGEQTFRTVFRAQALRLAKWMTDDIPYEPYSYDADGK